MLLFPDENEPQFYSTKTEMMIDFREVWHNDEEL